MVSIEIVLKTGHLTTLHYKEYTKPENITTGIEEVTITGQDISIFNEGAAIRGKILREELTKLLPKAISKSKDKTPYYRRFEKKKK